MARTRLDSDDIPMTHEFLSTMLGVRRTGVTEVAAKLRRAGLIRYHHGEITILDREALEATACECHRVDRRRAPADADERCVGGLQSGLCHQEQDEEARRGPRRGHADLHALEIGGRLVRSALAHRENDPGEPSELDKGTDVLAFRLHSQRVLISAGHDIDRAAHQGVE